MNPRLLYPLAQVHALDLTRATGAHRTENGPARAGADGSAQPRRGRLRRVIRLASAAR